MRILQLIKTTEGAAWAYRQVKVLIEQGANVAVCLPEGRMADKYRADGIAVYTLDFTLHPLKLNAAFKRFNEILKVYQPDIVHSHFFITTIFARLYRRFYKLDIPLVFQVPGPLHLEHFLFRNADLMTSGKNDYWVGSCKWTSDKYVSSGISRDKVFMSHYGTDLSYVKTHEKGKLRSELGLKNDDFIVAMIAFMYKPKPYLGQKKGIKGHEDFFEAIAKCIKQDSRIKAVVIGGAWDGAVEYEAQLKKMGKALCGDNIYFMGSRNDVPELYADVDLVVHPSYSENLGGAAESLLLAVPTITTNVGGFPDIVIEGETGYLVNPGAPDELAARIMDTVKAPARMKQMAIKGRDKAEQLLDVTITGKEVFNIYNKILNSEPVHVQVYQKAV